MQSPAISSLKRQHTEATSRATEEEPAIKRRKTFASGYSPEFWDKLSVVRLTRRSLKEFDQRIARSSFEQFLPPNTNQKSPSRRILRSTTKRIRQVVDQGGPDLSRLRGYATMPQSGKGTTQPSENSRKRSARSASTVKQTGKTKTTSPYSAEFEQKMIDLGVYPKSYRYPDGSRPPKPSNLEGIQEVLSRPRASLSPTIFPQSVFEDFQDQNELATSESKAMSRVFPIIAGSKDKQFESAENVPFNRLEKFEDDLTTPKPDIYYGAQPSQIDRQVRRDLQASIVPSSRQSLPAAPNFFVEGKSADGRADVAQRQAMYDGAVGASGILQLQNYGSPAMGYDGNAYTLSSTYHPGTGTLQMYATHPMESESRSGETEYCMTQLNGYYMIGDRENFVRGVSAFRNGREWARDQRDIHIAHANAVAKAKSPSTTGASGQGKAISSLTVNEENEESETSLDELSLPDPPKRLRPLGKSKKLQPAKTTSAGSAVSRRRSHLFTL